MAPEPLCPPGAAGVQREVPHKGTQPKLTPRRHHRECLPASFGPRFRQPSATSISVLLRQKSAIQPEGCMSGYVKLAWSTSSVVCYTCSNRPPPGWHFFSDQTLKQNSTASA